ncbi:MAG: hypothetical protein R6W92_06875 [Desulfocurvibacter africanus]
MKKAFKHLDYIIDPTPYKTEDGRYTASGNIYPEGHPEDGRYYDVITIAPKSFSTIDKATNIFIVFAKMRIASGAI